MGDPLVSEQTIRAVERVEELQAQEIRRQVIREICRSEGHDWYTTTTSVQRARGVETELCRRCGAHAETTRVVTEAEA
jgi:hypothetical protein